MLLHLCLLLLPAVMTAMVKMPASTAAKDLVVFHVHRAPSSTTEHHHRPILLEVQSPSVKPYGSNSVIVACKKFDYLCHVSIESLNRDENYTIGTMQNDRMWSCPRVALSLHSFLDTTKVYCTKSMTISTHGKNSGYSIVSIGFTLIAFGCILATMLVMCLPTTTLGTHITNILANKQERKTSYVRRSRRRLRSTTPPRKRNILETSSIDSTSDADSDDDYSDNYSDTDNNIIHSSDDEVVDEVDEVGEEVDEAEHSSIDTLHFGDLELYEAHGLHLPPMEVLQSTHHDFQEWIQQHIY